MVQPGVRAFGKKAITDRLPLHGRQRHRRRGSAILGDRTDGEVRGHRGARRRRDHPRPGRAGRRGRRGLTRRWQSPSRCVRECGASWVGSSGSSGRRQRWAGPAGGEHSNPPTVRPSSGAPRPSACGGGSAPACSFSRRPCTTLDRFSRLSDHAPVPRPCLAARPRPPHPPAARARRAGGAPQGLPVRHRGLRSRRAIPWADDEPAGERHGRAAHVAPGRPLLVSRHDREREQLRPHEPGQAHARGGLRSQPPGRGPRHRQRCDARGGPTALPHVRSCR